MKYLSLVKSLISSCRQKLKPFTKETQEYGDYLRRKELARIRDNMVFALRQSLKEKEIDPTSYIKVLSEITEAISEIESEWEINLDDMVPVKFPWS